MATLVSFDFEPWDKKNDILLERPGSMLGFTAILTSLEVGDTQTVRARQRDQLIRETEEGVIGIIAGGIEWLRMRGYSAADVENKVRVYKANNLAKAETAILKDSQDAIQTISNPRQLNISASLVIG